MLRQVSQLFPLLLLVSAQPHAGSRLAVQFAMHFCTLKIEWSGVAAYSIVMLHRVALWNNISINLDSIPECRSNVHSLSLCMHGMEKCSYTCNYNYST